MVKAHTPINWQNKPSVNTPINETNLNKMDSTIGILDDRIIEQDTSKLDKSTAYTMVKDISFNDNNGVFTVTRLNGSTFTIDTRLEKIAINFKYDYYTQKLIVTLIDGTTQSIDMSALLTQYEFTDSDTIGWEVAEDGTVKAKVLDGSITEDMLQHNYLADIKVETAKSESYMNSAKTSEINASSSANLAQSYAVGGTGTRDGEDTDNAKYYSENAQPLAQSVSGENPTATNSTNAPLIYGKFGGYTLQDGTPTPDVPIEIKGLGDSGTIEVKTCGKNRLKITNTTETTDGITFTVNEDGTITINGTSTTDINFDVTHIANITGNGNIKRKLFQLNGSYTGTVEHWAYTSNWGHAFSCPIGEAGFLNTDVTYNIFRIKVISGTVCNNLKVGFMVAEDVSEYEPYTETTATIPIDTLYEGDYLEVYADGSGQIVRENKERNFVCNAGVANPFTNSKELRMVRPSDMASAKFYCDKATYVSNTWNNDQVGICAFAGDGLRNISIRVANDVDPNSFTAKMVYKLATPTTEPLTAEQVAEFMKLQTFKPVTNVLADGEVTVKYYCNNDSGETVAKVSKKANNSVSKSSIANNLTTTTEGMVLDATQGKALNDKISTLNYSLENRLSKSLVSKETINIDSLSLSSGGHSTIISEEIPKSGYTLVSAKFFLRGSYAENIIASFTIGGLNTKMYNFAFYNPSDYNISAYGYVDLIYVANSL